MPPADETLARPPEFPRLLIGREGPVLPVPQRSLEFPGGPERECMFPVCDSYCGY
jgi:hypothetical protein